jgi:hypothetical protein
MRTGCRIVHAFGGAVCAALLCAPSVALAATGAAEAHPSTTIGVVSAAPPASVLAPQPVVAEPARGARHRLAHPLREDQPVSAIPAVSSSSLAGGSGSLLSNFNGVSSRDSAVTNFGQEFEPPDQGLCVGNGFVVEMVNSAYTVFEPSGNVVTGPFNVNGPFGEGLTEFTSDPRCYYDPATHTWFATILGINKALTASTLDIAVNSSGDPTTPWTFYKIDTTAVGGKTGVRHKGCPCFGDQPTLGMDAHNLYVSTNEFSIEGEQFNGAQIYAFAKKDLVALNPAVHFVHFENLSIDGALASSVQPALTTGKAKGEFFLSSIDPTETSGQSVGVWALSDVGAVAKGGTPVLSSQVLLSEPFGVPPGGEQKGASSLINSGDDRMQQTQFIDGSLWGELDTAINIGNERTTRAGAAWFQVGPKLRKGLVSGSQIERQGYVSAAANYVLYPALQTTPSGTAAMVMTVTGSKRFPSAAYATLAPGATAFGPLNVAAGGSTNYDPEAERWGDYSWAVIDPTGESVWLATEYVPPKASQTPDTKHDWGTRVLDVSTAGG